MAGKVENVLFVASQASAVETKIIQVGMETVHRRRYKLLETSDMIVCHQNQVRNGYMNEHLKMY